MSGSNSDTKLSELTVRGDDRKTDRQNDGVRLLHFTKSFAGRKVLDDVGFTVPDGTVVGLLGQNGSGKSTLIKLLAGYHDPDHGCGAAVVVGGKRTELPIRGGEFTVATVHQDLALVGDASVAENLLIASMRKGSLSGIRWSTIHRRAKQMLEACGAADIDPRTKVADLRPVQRAAVAIARALESIRDGGLLILDEVTAFLPQDAVEQLFAVVRELTARGVSVLFVSHRMEEVFAICDRAVVLRGGRLVSDVRVNDTSEGALITDIVGESLGWLYPDKHSAGRSVRFTASKLHGGGLKDVSFEANEGEIVGLTGLKG
ncbi:MAG: ribose transport system ATP-binding protein, partial [Actinomycetota bacterium]|nr:ribose transport system ATP-binding protein [Actinomycetota bacterium]